MEIRVGKISEHDTGKGIARLDVQTMSELGLHVNEVLLIESRYGRTGVLLKEPHPYKMKRLLIDDVTRRNAKIDLGENVEIERAEKVVANRAIVAADKWFPIVFKDGFVDDWRQPVLPDALHGHVVCPGDLVEYPLVVIKNSEIWHSLCLIKITEVQPNSQPVLITKDTEIDVITKHTIF